MSLLLCTRDLEINGHRSVSITGQVISPVSCEHVAYIEFVSLHFICCIVKLYPIVLWCQFLVPQAEKKRTVLYCVHFNSFLSIGCAVIFRNVTQKTHMPIFVCLFCSSYHVFFKNKGTMGQLGLTIDMKISVFWTDRLVFKHCSRLD